MQKCEKNEQNMLTVCLSLNVHTSRVGSQRCRDGSNDAPATRFRRHAIYVNGGGLPLGLVADDDDETTTLQPAETTVNVLAMGSFIPCLLLPGCLHRQVRLYP
jgi:hypothetical protein